MSVVSLSLCVQFKAWSRPDSVQQTAYALEVGTKVMPFFDDYFGIHFPLPEQGQGAWVPREGVGMGTRSVTGVWWKWEEGRGRIAPDNVPADVLSRWQKVRQSRSNDDQFGQGTKSLYNYKVD